MFPSTGLTVYRRLVRVGHARARRTTPSTARTHSPVVVTGQPATRAFSECGRPGLGPDGRHLRRHRRGVPRRGRVAPRPDPGALPSDGAATAAVSSAHDALAGCRTTPRNRGTAPTHTVLDIPLGDRSVVWTDTYWFISRGRQAARHRSDASYSLVSVGRAVLLAYEYGEGNGSRRSPGPTASLEADASRSSSLVRWTSTAMRQLKPGQPPAGSPASARRSRTASCRPSRRPPRGLPSWRPRCRTSRRRWRRRGPWSCPRAR